MSKRLTIEEFIETLKQGGSSEPMIVTLGSEDYPMPNHTWNEIYDAVLAGVPVVVSDTEFYKAANPVTRVYIDRGDSREDDHYAVVFGGSGSMYASDPDSLEGWLYG